MSSARPRLLIPQPPRHGAFANFSRGLVIRLRALLFGIILVLGDPFGCGPTDIGSLSWGLHGSSSSHAPASRASLARIFLGRYHRRRGLRDVLLWHELSRGTGSELCSPVKALIWCRSAASPQVLFLLEGSLSYHCACRLRLAESCIFFFLRFPSAAHGYLLSILRFSVFTHCVWSLALCPQSLLVVFHTLCVGSRSCCESLCLLSRARHWRRNRAGTTHVVRPSFQGLQVDILRVLVGLVIRDPSLPAVYIG